MLWGGIHNDEILTINFDDGKWYFPDELMKMGVIVASKFF
jgi:hypothetical protein